METSVIKPRATESGQELRIEPLADHVDKIPILADWLYREWGYLEPQSSKEWVASRLAERLQRSTVPICFVALNIRDETPRLVGTISVKFREMELYPQLHYWVGSLLVEDSQRGQGIGSELVRHVVAWGREQRIETMHLYTKGQEGFYAALGWQTIATPVYRGEATTVMRISLS